MTSDLTSEAVWKTSFSDLDDLRFDPIFGIVTIILRRSKSLYNKYGPRSDYWLWNFQNPSSRFGENDERSQNSFCYFLSFPQASPLLLSFQASQADSLPFSCWLSLPYSEQNWTKQDTRLKVMKSDLRWPPINLTHKSENLGRPRVLAWRDFVFQLRE